MKKNKIAIVRGKFLNKFDMQSYEHLMKYYDITAIGSLTSIHDSFAFPLKKLISPVDMPDFPFKMQILNRVFIDAQYLFGLENTLKGYDIAHSAETYFGYTRQCLQAKRMGNVKKVVVTQWENIPFNNSTIWGRKAFKKRAIKEVDHFIAVSRDAKRVLVKEGSSERKITIISPGVNTLVFKPRNKKKTEKIKILFVGRLEKEKGIYDVIKSFSKLANNKDLRSRLSLTIVGRGTQLKNLLNLEKELNIHDMVVHKTVSYSDMPREYQSADIFIAPSKSTKYWKEQFGMMLLEAQASGLPIVTTRSGSIEENVGEAAILVEEGDVSGLSQALKNFVADPKLRLKYSKKARQRALKLYDVNIISEKIRKVYEKVL